MRDAYEKPYAIDPFGNLYYGPAPEECEFPDDGLTELTEDEIDNLLREEVDDLSKANQMLSMLQNLVRRWVGKQPVNELYRNRLIAKKLELVEQGVKLIHAGLTDGEAS